MDSLKEWLKTASLLMVVLATILGGMFGAVRLGVAPLQAEVAAVNGRLDRMYDEIKATRVIITNLDKRLTRVETLLERDTYRPDTAVYSP